MPIFLKCMTSRHYIREDFSSLIITGTQVSKYIWWLHSMKTLSVLLAICAGNSPAQRPVTRYLDVFFELCLSKRLSKLSWGWWFKMPSHQLWRHCNDADVTTHPFPKLTDEKIVDIEKGITRVSLHLKCIQFPLMPKINHNLMEQYRYLTLIIIF